ncbi:MAG TPA: DUF1559 domain-containing protein, partial [Gemmataceae bacterium]|nr:DUF1559 domain-containing protein [Gemmataceae bacterium]
KFQTAGWAFQILPYIEQQNLYNTPDIIYDSNGNPTNVQLCKTMAVWGPQYPVGSYFINMDLPTANAPGPVRLTPVKTYYCPSRRAAALYGGVATIDYAAAHPDTAVPIPARAGGTQPWSDIYSCAFAWWGDEGQHGVLAGRRYGKVTFASIIDGTANTMAVGEKFMRPEWYGGNYPGDWRGFVGGGIVDDRRTTGVETSPSSDPSQNLALANPAHDVNYPTSSTSTDDSWRADAYFGSAHPAGINAVFADGSVHHVKFGIDPQVFNALGHRNDGTNLANDPDSF